MNVKLGQAVEFDRCLLPAGPLNTCNLTEEQQEEYEEFGHVTRQKYREVVLPKPRQGIVIGARRMTTSHELIDVDGGEYNDDYWQYLSGSGKYETIILVATGLWRFYKLRPEWLREATP